MKVKLTESQLRDIIREAVKNALNENLSNVKKPFFVSDDGGVYNAFAVDMFSNGGYLEGHNGEDGYHFDDFDKLKWFNSWEAACDFADRMNDEY